MSTYSLSEPVDRDQSPASASELLEICRTLILRYIVLSEDQAVILAVWSLHTHVFHVAEVTPYVHVSSPERECGSRTH